MKNKFILQILVFLCAQNLWAQKNLVASYQISSTNPYDVASHWLLFDNSEFAVVRSNTIIAGNYEQNEEEIAFTPSVPKEPFQVFGRYNPEISGSKIMLKDINIHEKVYLATTTEELYALLRKKSKCVPKPLVKSFDEPISNLILSNYIGDEEVTNKFSSEFNLENYNDFIIIYFNSQKILPPFKGKIHRNKLRVEAGLMSATNLMISEDDDYGVKASVEKLIKFFNQNSIISDSDYNFVSLTEDESTDIERRLVNTGDYDFDSASETYFVRDSSNNEEKIPRDFEKLYVYKMLQYSQRNTPAKLHKKSMFTPKCQ